MLVNQAGTPSRIPVDAQRAKRHCVGLLRVLCVGENGKRAERRSRGAPVPDLDRSLKRGRWLEDSRANADACRGELVVGCKFQRNEALLAICTAEPSHCHLGEHVARRSTRAGEELIPRRWLPRDEWGGAGPSGNEPRIASFLLRQRFCSDIVDRLVRRRRVPQALLLKPYQHQSARDARPDPHRRHAEGNHCDKERPPPPSPRASRFRSLIFQLRLHNRSPQVRQTHPFVPVTATHPPRRCYTAPRRIPKRAATGDLCGATIAHARKPTELAPWVE